MRVTVDIYDDLLQRAQDLSGIQDPTALLHEALKALVARETLWGLARLRGQFPQELLDPEAIQNVIDSERP